MLPPLPRLMGALSLWMLALPAPAVDWQEPAVVAHGGGAPGPPRQKQ